MARFLKNSDYLSIIQTADLLQIIESDYNNLYDAETKGIAKLRTKLVGRYDMDYELQGTLTPYSASTKYFAGQRVTSIGGTRYFYVNSFSEWIETANYLTGDIVKSNLGIVYTALQNSKNVALTSTTYWSVMENIPPTDAPASTLWSSATAYVVGNHVHTSAGLVYISIQNGTNKPVTDTNFWTPVTVTVDTDYWTEGDNRYALFVEYAMDLTLFYLYSRINPRNIPDLRKERYIEAMEAIERWASGTDTAEVKQKDIEASTGYSIRYGSSSTKQNNFF
jgi:hypothetical protein